MKRDSVEVTDGVVLLFVVPKHRSQREKTSGVYAAAMRRGWQIQPVETCATARRIRAEVDLWHPLGCLIDKSAMPERSRLDKAASCGVPTVLMGNDSGRRVQIFDRSVQDGLSTVAAAVNELAAFSPASFAFVGEPGGPSWSVERGAAFEEAVSGLGHVASAYRGPSPYTSAGRSRLAQWLAGLERPCGVMIAADHLATHLYAAANAAGLSIPGDLAVVGVDNDEDICGNVNPPLSSVQLDYFHAGENAVMLLERRLAAPRNPPMTEIYQATGVVRRPSSIRPLSNVRVSAALSFIAMHAHEGVSVPEVVARMGCCRRLAERMFKKGCGKTILDAIHEARMDKALALLRRGSFPIDAIPGACGYASVAFFKSLFKRRTGMTMREWRKAELSGPAENR